MCKNIAAHQAYISKRKPYAHVYTCWEVESVSLRTLRVHVYIYRRARKKGNFD